jgi:mono/diheme cytochrome c family protein
MNTNGLLHSLLISLLAISTTSIAAEPTDRALIDRGRYLVVTSACNDCHTPGYMKEGKVPEPLWLTGTDIGFQGPWGTSYPANLRLKLQALSEAQWIERARQPMRPPMPWFNLRDMNDDDLRAIYRYIRAAGPAGEPAPDAVPPGVAVTTPYFDFTVKNLPPQQAMTSDVGH